MDGQMNDSPHKLMEDLASEVRDLLIYKSVFQAQHPSEAVDDQNSKYTPSCFLLTHYGICTRMY